MLPFNLAYNYIALREIALKLDHLFNYVVQSKHKLCTIEFMRHNLDALNASLRHHNHPHKLQYGSKFSGFDDVRHVTQRLRVALEGCTGSVYDICTWLAQRGEELT